MGGSSTASGEIKITYEVLYEILRHEKDRPELQLLDQDFYAQVVGYLLQKKEILERQKAQSDVFSLQEKGKVEKQMENIVRLLQELFQRREKKTVMMAINISRTKSQLVNTTTLLPEEQIFLDSLVHVLDAYRDDVFAKLLLFQHPVVRKVNGMTLDSEAREEKKQLEQKVKLRFLAPIDTFIGTDLQTYGPYHDGDIAELGREVAMLLINKGKAVESFIDEN
ncbi:DNA replication complex GINS family protein [Candidatus Woesearchaeota archaeon]|nr:DNA replication complex GINS family protein [Candidatus Woesearchaeota archaeon]